MFNHLLLLNEIGELKDNISHNSAILTTLKPEESTFYFQQILLKIIEKKKECSNIEQQIQSQTKLLNYERSTEAQLNRVIEDLRHVIAEEGSSYLQDARICLQDTLPSVHTSINQHSSLLQGLNNQKEDINNQIKKLEPIWRVLFNTADYHSKLDKLTPIVLLAKHHYWAGVIFLCEQGKIPVEDLNAALWHTFSKTGAEAQAARLALLHAGGNPNIADEAGESFIHKLACQRRLSEIANLLTYDPKLQYENVKAKYPDLKDIPYIPITTKNLTDIGAYCVAEPPLPKSKLENLQLSILKTVLAKGANPNTNFISQDLRKSQFTLLELAVKRESTTMIALLLKYGTDPYATNKEDEIAVSLKAIRAYKTAIENLKIECATFYAVIFQGIRQNSLLAILPKDILWCILDLALPQKLLAHEKFNLASLNKIKDTTAANKIECEAFKVIYAALRTAEGGFFKSNFLKKKENLSSVQLTQAIKSHLQTKGDSISRTNVAQRLAKEYKHNIHRNNMELIKDMYKGIQQLSLFSRFKEKSITTEDILQNKDKKNTIGAIYRALPQKID